MTNLKSRVVTVALHPDVAKKVSSENRNSIRQLEREFRKRINIIPQENLHIEDIKIS